MRKHKKHPGPGKYSRLLGLDKKYGEDSLKEDVGLTDKKGDNMLSGRDLDFDEMYGWTRHNEGPTR
ncbi:MAG: hypothetical protein V4649_18025 [Bacteroidota bacterium]